MGEDFSVHIYGHVISLQICSYLFMYILTHIHAMFFYMCMCVLYADVCVHMFVYSHVCRCACPYIYMSICSREVVVKCLPWWISMLYFESGSLCEMRTCRFSYSSWLPCPWRIVLFRASGNGLIDTPTGLHVFIESLVSTEPPAQSLHSQITSKSILVIHSKNLEWSIVWKEWGIKMFEKGIEKLNGSSLIYWILITYLTLKRYQQVRF